MSMTHEDALRKIQGLLRLADSADANEAAVAAAQAQKLMDRYKIERAMAELDTTTTDVDDGEEPIACPDPIETNARATWKGVLAVGICKVNQVAVMRDTNKSIMAFGRPSDLNTVRYLYSYLVREVDRLCDLLCQGCGRTYRNNFRLGAVGAINARLAEQLQKLRQELLGTAANNERALVLVDDAFTKLQKRGRESEDFMHRQFKNLRNHHTRYRYDDHARSAGARAGQRVSLGGKAALGAGRKQLRN